MNLKIILAASLLFQQVVAAPVFLSATPKVYGSLEFDPERLCKTAKQTLAYLDKGYSYDPLVIHSGLSFRVSLDRIKATLRFICQNQAHMQDPSFIQNHFEMIQWHPDKIAAKRLASGKPLLKNLPQDQILMTKYYVHLAKGSLNYSVDKPYALYGLPKEEHNLSLDEANAKSELIRFKYGKQAILSGALKDKAVPILAYLNREDLESALMQGTVVVDFGKGRISTFNVHRNNNIAYDKNKPPYQQERYWYFKQVQGIKGYGKDADHKITVNTEVTFAADLAQLGLGKLLMIQYKDKSGILRTRMGILADTGGAFTDNLYQIDYLAGSYPGKEAFYQQVRGLPDYVSAYFMLLKYPFYKDA